METKKFSIKQVFIGRIGRKHFIFFILVSFAINIVSKLILAYSGLTWVITIPLFILILGMTIRRFHDFNCSGWWSSLPFLFQALLAFSVSGMSAIDQAGTFPISGGVLIALLTFATLAWIVVMIFLLIKRGTKTENRFGSVYPRDADLLTAVFNLK